MALTNNDVLKKLRVALQLRDEDIIHILSLVDFKIGKSELGAFFRKEDHPKYVELQDQILRNFLNGLVIHMRGPEMKKPKQEDLPVTKAKKEVPALKKPKYADPAIKPKKGKTLPFIKNIEKRKPWKD